MLSGSNFPMGVGECPLIHSPFVEQFEEQGDFPPPTTSFRITDSSEQRVTDSGDKRITD